MTDLIALNDSSRVWIYQADSFFEESEIYDVLDEIRSFVDHWASHNKDLKAYGNLFHQRFIGLFVDESLTSASGCSIDSSVRFLNALGAKYGKNLIEREHFAYIDQDEVKMIHMNALQEAYQKGEITEETLFFDHLVKTKADFIDSWVKPLKDSFHKRFI